jgi:amino acid transporter
MDSAQDVRSHSAELKKELGLGDLVLVQILYVVGSHWVGTAAKLGNQQLVFWLLAVTLFYAPLAAVVIYLNRILPLEGGLYQWAKIGFNDFIGFLTGWNLWLYIILFMSSQGMNIANNIAYAFGLEWMAAEKWFNLLVTGALVVFLVVVTVLGLSVGKWVQNGGSIAQIVTFALLILVPFLSLRSGALHAYHPLAAAMPAISLFSLNILGKMSFGAFSGFEYVAILAGECKNPARIGRSVLLAAPIIVLMFILGTSALLAYSSPEQVDLLGPIPQALSIAFRSFAWAGLIGPVAILLLVGRQLGASTLAVAGSTRLPMVAGWDHLLPHWFSKLHPRFKTPVNSILFVGAMILVAGVASLVGVGQQEAFQILDNASGILYSLAYLVMFALPLVGLRRVADTPPLWLRMTAGVGFAVTLLYSVLSVFPIIEVASRLSFVVKVGGLVVFANLLGAALYWMEKRK